MSSTAKSSGEHCTILVVEDHPTTLAGIRSILNRFYASAQVTHANTFDQALASIQALQPDLVILDLQIPRQDGDLPTTEKGIEVLKTLMQTYPHLNIAVHSSYLDALVRIRPDIDNHLGGFTVTDKGRSTQETFERFDCALKGYTHTRDIRGMQAGLELKPEWLTTLDLACCSGFQDRAIAQKLHVSEGMVRNYWSKIYDVLSVYPEDEREVGKNLRVITCIKAREKGLIA
ncbi:response regulator transcription factor [Leptolyngbya sp. PCC 6406]|uniref:response regulator n=1 Tax=Leptolyngbya sp. PCC 6406 TaxID=1173264 RepID=UPI0002ABBC41|nr:response regulator transcription factor [Leptolyngbya sp. PCC 6406]